MRGRERYRGEKKNQNGGETECMRKVPEEAKVEGTEALI